MKSGATVQCAKIEVEEAQMEESKLVLFGQGVVAVV